MKYITKKDIKLPKRKSSSKKGDNGKLLIVAGSEEYVGAAALAGLAALRSGVDWVTIIAPEKVAWAINTLSPDVVTMKLKGTFLKKSHTKKIIEEAKKHSTILVGNGIGANNETIQCVKEINEKIETQKVIDADGIKALTLQELSSTIITPHLKELEKILLNSFISTKDIRKITEEKNIERRAKQIKQTIEQLDVLFEDKKSFFEKDNVIVLKGPVDTIITKNKIYYSKTGNAGLTKAGTGDVLAGLTAGFLAQSNDLTQSAVNGAYFNGLIGDMLLKKKKGFTYLASDMVAEINKVTTNS